MIQRILTGLMIVLIVSCQNETPTQTLALGTYRAVLEVQDNETLPFIFEVEADNRLKIFNAEEVITVDEVEYRNDSVFIKAPVFEGYIAATFEDNNLKGEFIKESLNRIVPFTAEYQNTSRFPTAVEATRDATGIWQVTFSPREGDDKYSAKGIFKQNGNTVTGTFRTTTGDYRYLEGVMDGNTMKLSTFDGAHAFLFTATVTDFTMNGMFYSGNYWKEAFVAIRNSTYELPDANELTFLKDGYDTLAFEFPDENGNLISLEDERFQDKVVLVQIMGSWCPNCLDESK
ncbi:MAG: TlpA family protein disulfide reductase, partial [Bacteroidota bacterium]